MCVSTAYFEQLIAPDDRDLVPVARARRVLGEEPKALYQLAKEHPDLFVYIKRDGAHLRTLHVHVPAFKKFMKLMRKQHDSQRSQRA